MMMRPKGCGRNFAYCGRRRNGARVPDMRVGFVVIAFLIMAAGLLECIASFAGSGVSLPASASTLALGAILLCLVDIANAIDRARPE